MTKLLHRTERLSDSITVLNDVMDEHCNLAIWQRAPITGLDTLLTAATSDLQFAGTLADLSPFLRTQMPVSGFAQNALCDVLIADIFALARCYCSILKCDQLLVRLKVVTTDSCRKFHADYVSVRLITTYLGAGTDWLDAADSARVNQGLEPLQIQSLRAGDVGLFKGHLATKTPAIHRSPPIAGTGQKRLLLVLNPPAKG